VIVLLLVTNAYYLVLYFEVAECIHINVGYLTESGISGGNRHYRQILGAFSVEITIYFIFYYTNIDWSRGKH